MEIHRFRAGSESLATIAAIRATMPVVPQITAQSVPMLRAVLEANLAQPLPPGAQTRQVAVAGGEALHLTVDGRAGDATLLFVHGGAYCIGSPAAMAPVAAEIARDGGFDAILPRYPLAPEAPFPAAHDRIVDALAAVLREAGDRPVVLAGESAGGGLALAAAIALRGRGGPLPAALLLFCPWVDLRCRFDVDDAGAPDKVIAPSALRAAAALVAGDTAVTDPRLSPVLADLSGLPPILISTGEDDLLLADSDRLFDALRATGGRGGFHRWEGMPHGWYALPGVPEGRQALAAAARFAREAIGSGGAANAPGAGGEK